MVAEQLGDVSPTRQMRTEVTSNDADEPAWSLVRTVLVWTWLYCPEDVSGESVGGGTTVG